MDNTRYMMYVSSMTSKGQATIPIDVRKYLGLELGDKVAFFIQNNQVQIAAQKSFLDLRGSVKTKAKLSDRDWDKKVLKWVGKQVV